MNTALQKIETFNKESGLLNNGYDELKEAAYLIEEALEDLELTALAIALGAKDLKDSPKLLARHIMSFVAVKDTTEKVNIIDKHLDSIVFNIGGLLKQDLTVEQIALGLNIVADANLTKLTVGLDAEGKQMKPKDFIPPEETLKKALSL